MTSFDVIIIGAGHNGMTAATVLAKSGRKVLVVEAANAVGGMGQTTELAPGFRVSPVAHILNRLHPQVIAALQLEKHGLRLDTAPAPTLALAADGGHVVLHGGYGGTTDGLSPADATAWQNLRKRLLLQSSLFRRFLDEIPVQPGATSARQKLKAAKAALDLKLKGKEELRQFLRMALMCVADVVDEDLESDPLKGLLAFDATLGIRLGPRSPTSLLGLYYRLAGGMAGMPGAQIVPRGGIGAVMEAFARSAAAADVQFRMGTGVGRILLDGAKVCGVETTRGEVISAPRVLSAISPADTLVNLVGTRSLDTGLVRDLKTIRARGNVSRLNLALDRSPDFTGVAPALHTARMVHAPSINAVERGFNPSKYSALPDAPAFELVLPAATDASLAPDGAAVLSIAIQNTPYDLKEGWASGRIRLQDSVLSALEKLAPGIGKSVIAADLLTPVDIEARFNVPGGHWHHGEMQIDRIHALRPVFGIAHYRAPVAGLYLCGAGTHPGGGICGASGLNAARALIADQKGSRA